MRGFGFAASIQRRVCRCLKIRRTPLDREPDGSLRGHAQRRELVDQRRTANLIAALLRIKRNRPPSACVDRSDPSPLMPLCVRALGLREAPPGLPALRGFRWAHPGGRCFLAPREKRHDAQACREQWQGGENPPDYLPGGIFDSDQELCGVIAPNSCYPLWTTTKPTSHTHSGE